MRRFNIPFRINSLFLKIWLSFLSLLLPIIVIGVVFYVQHLDYQKTSFKEKVQVNLHRGVLAIDDHIGAIRQFNIGFIAEENILGRLLPYASYTMEQRSELYKIVQNILSESSLIDSVDSVFVYADDRKVYTGTMVDDFTTFFESHMVFADYGPDFWRRQISSSNLFAYYPPTMLQVPGKNARRVMPIVSSQLVRGNYVAVAVAFDMKVMSDILRGGGLFETTAHAVVDGDGTLLHTEAPSLFDADTLAKLQAEFADAEALSLELDMGGQRMIVTIDASAPFGWTYFSATPVAEFMRQAKSMRDMIVYICVVLIVIGLLFSFLFAFYLYNPIRAIQDILTGGDAEDGTGGGGKAKENELQYIGTKINRLIDHTNQFKYRLDSVSREYLENSLFNLLVGNRPRSDQELQAIYEELLPFDKSHFLCCNMAFSFMDSFYHAFSVEQQEVIIGKLRRVIRGVLNEATDSLYVLESKADHLYVCILNLDGRADTGPVKEALRRLLRIFEYDSLYCALSIGIGKVYPGIGGISLSCADAMTALQNANDESGFAMVDFADLPVQRLFYYPFTEKLRLLRLIEQGDSAKLIAVLEELISQNRSRYVSHEAFQTLLFELYNTGLKWAADNAAGQPALLGEREHRLLRDLNANLIQADEKIRILLSFYRELVRVSLARVKKPDDSPGHIVEGIRRYIEEHYRDELYLDKLADEFGVSPGYVSRVFKERTKLNLTDYIGAIRIENAKRLLADTDLSISEVARQTGIYNRTTFLRLFKKGMGMSPNEYRQRMKDNE